MTQKNTLLKKTRNDLLNIISDPSHASAFALRSAVRRYLRDIAPAEASLSSEILHQLSSAPTTIEGLETALPHRRRADISRTIIRLATAGRIAHAGAAGWKKTTDTP